MPKTITCPALDTPCPECPAVSLCQLVSGGWEIAYTPALDTESMPAPEIPESRPVALQAPIQSPIPGPRHSGAPYKRMAKGQRGFPGMGKY